MIKKVNHHLRLSKPFIPVLTILVWCSGCSKSDVSSKCIEGEVIGFIECLNIQLLSVDATDIKGEPLSWEGKEYGNVVQSPGGKIESGRIFFNYRDFKPEDNKSAIACPANVAPVPVPKITLLNYSPSNCP